MKKYILPTVVSLTLSAPVVFAQQDSQEGAPPMPAKPPTTQEQPERMRLPIPSVKTMQEQQERMRLPTQRMTLPGQERHQRLMQMRLVELQRQVQELKAMINASSAPERKGNTKDMPMHMPEMMGDPRWGGRPMPPYSMPHNRGRIQNHQQHWTRMEQHLQKIIKLLEQIVAHKTK